MALTIEVKFIFNSFPIENIVNTTANTKKNVCIISVQIIDFIPPFNVYAQINITEIIAFK